MKRCALVVFATLLSGCGGQATGGADDAGGLASPSDAGNTPSSDAMTDAKVAAAPDATVGTPAVVCDTKKCAPGETCCVESGKASCKVDACAGAVLRIGCEDSSQCGAQNCCYMDTLSSALAATTCLDDCGALGGVEACGGACNVGEACVKYECGAFGGASGVVLGLCTRSPPSSCK